MKIIYDIAGGAIVVVSLVLIYLIWLQDGKNDGLQSQIGTASVSAFKGKAGQEERLNEWTKKWSIAFFVLCLIMAWAQGHS